MLLAQILYGGLVFSALFTQHEKSVSIVNGMVGSDMADHLGFQLRAGKKITARTASAFLNKYRSRADADHMLITDAVGRVTARWTAQEASLPDQTPANAPGEKYTGFSKAQFSVVSHPACGRNGICMGSVVIAADRKRMAHDFFRDAGSLLLQYGIISAGVCAAFLFLMFFRQKNCSASGGAGALIRKHPYASLRICFLLPLLLGQIFFLILLKAPVTELYEKELGSVGQHLALNLQWDLERLVGIGMPLSMISGIDGRMASCQQGTPSLGMAVLDAQGHILAGANVMGSLTADEWHRISNRGALLHKSILPQGSPQPAGSIAVVMDPSQTARNLNSVLLDNLSMTVVAVIFLYELLFLFLPVAGGGSFSSSPAFMRTVVFGSLFATEMATAYAPIRIGELGLELFGLPPDVVSGLPVSCEMFMAGLAMFLGGFWSRKSGWRPMLMTGISLCCAGSFASSLSASPLPFLIARGISGLGYGFINLAAQIFIIAHADPLSRAKNLAFMFAGLYAGALCGSTMGGLIADRLGYSAVFPSSAAMLLAMAAAVFFAAPREPWQKEEARGKSSFSGLARFLLDRRMAGLLLFLVIHNALVTVCLSQYFLPLSLSRSGVSPADIGRVFMAYCIIVMLTGPLFGAIIDRTEKKASALFCSMVLAALSISMLLADRGIWGAVFSAGILAMSTAIASNGQGAYALSLPASARFGRAGTIGAYNVAMRSGQVLGPVSLGTLNSLWSVRAGLAILVCFSLASALLFLLLSGSRRKNTAGTLAAGGSHADP